MYYYHWDNTYLLVILGVLLCLGASGYVKAVMHKYNMIRNASGMTGAEAARQILDREGLYHVRVECMEGITGDHYDPSTETVRLSRKNYTYASITSVSVAAHECGHAIQDYEGYFPLAFRSKLVPVTNFGSRLGMPIIFLGVLLAWNQTLIDIGIWVFSLTLLFQLVTLPVEFNASRRALARLEEHSLLSLREQDEGKKVLTAAALTYVAAAAASALELLRLVILFGGGGRRRND